MAVLVLGASGLIGQEIVGRLVTDGFSVIGLGRSGHRDLRIAWRQSDIARLANPDDWGPLLVGVDAIVNAAGALQTGLRDDVAAVQDRAMQALYKAATSAGVGRFVQISASGATLEASTLFMRSKAAADQALKASGLSWVILRPALVIAPAAYGGSALLRALSAFPFVRPLVFAAAPMRTVPVSAVSAMVSRALNADIAPGSDLILVEDQARTLSQVTALLRQWLGLRPVPVLGFPPFVASIISAGADVLGWLGWRSPLRSSALAVMRDGVALDGPGDPACDLELTLARMPALPQDLWFARLWLLKPILFGALSVFWLVSGAMGLVQAEAAQLVLAGAGLSVRSAIWIVAAGSAADIALGLLVLFRPVARAALIGMLLVTAAYWAGSIALAPQLWADPLGPMVKTVPIFVLTLVALAILEER